MRYAVSWLVAVLTGIGLLAVTSGTGGPIHAGESEVDLALVLALDCSGSVDEQEFALQMEGLGRAFQRQEIHDAIRHGTLQRIAVSVMQWSGRNNQVTVLPWTVISNADEAKRFGVLLGGTRRGLDPTATSISSALIHADDLLSTSPRAARQVVDLSADGPNNVGPPLQVVRRRLLDKGITINGLAIQNEWRALGNYLEAEVAGGEGHFVVRASDYADFSDAMFRKLLKEITGPGTS